MKRLFTIHYSLFISVALLTSCTLYMDEPEDAGRILRTGEGYDEVETITLPEGQGTVSYQYSQNTIPIDDVVEQYIVKVESDTILYFSFATPEELLPEVGEMMTCSFRDRFPHAFCHKCIERTEQDGIYRCVFRKCGFDEAFAHLDFDIFPTEPILPEGAELLSTEETDSIMNGYENDEPAEAREMECETRSSYRKEFNAVKVTIPNLTLMPTVLNQSVTSISGDITIKLGGYAEVTYNTSLNELIEEWGLHGDVSMKAQLTGGVGVRFESPVAIPILGFKADLIIVGIDLGFTLSPYFELKEETTAMVEFNRGVDIALSYSRVGNSDGKFDTKKNKIRKKRGLPMFNIRGDGGNANSTGLSLRIRDGYIFSCGLGGDVLSVKADLSVGADVYTDYKVYVDLNQYQSPEDFKQKIISQPTYTEFYVQAAAGALGFNLPFSLRTNPIETEGTTKASLWPVYKEGTAYIYCSDFNPRTYKMGFELDEEGLICAFMGSKPQLRVFGDGWGTDEALETFQMDWDNGSDYKKSTATKKTNNLYNNYEYLGNAVMVVKMPRFQYAIPIADIPFITEVPELYVSDEKVKVVQTLTPQNATPQELANPSVIARKGDTYAWVYEGAAYRYRYKIDVPITVEGARLIRTWGIQIGDKYAKDSNFSHKESKSDNSIDYVVRMTWFTNETSTYLYFRPWADTQDAKGNKGGKKWYEAAEITANYSKLLDKQFSITDKSPDFEKSRSMYDTPWNVATTDLPFGDKPVIGDIELIPIE